MIDMELFFNDAAAAGFECNMVGSVPDAKGLYTVYKAKSVVFAHNCEQSYDEDITDSLVKLVELQLARRKPSNA